MMLDRRKYRFLSKRCNPTEYLLTWVAGQKKPAACSGVNALAADARAVKWKMRSDDEHFRSR